MTENDNGYPRVLDRKGCLYGQHYSERFDKLEVEVKDEFATLRDKVDKLRQSAWGVAISLVVASLMLALNIIIK